MRKKCRACESGIIGKRGGGGLKAQGASSTEQTDQQTGSDGQQAKGK